MTKRVSFARPRSGPVGPHAEVNTGSAVGGRGVVPPKGGTTTPLTPSRPAPAKKEKEKVSLDYVLELVDGLDAAEQRQVLAHLALRNQKALAEKSIRDVDMWSTAVYEALVASFGRADGAVQAPLVIRGLVGAHKAWAPVDGFMGAAGFDKLKVVERQGVYRFLAEMVLRRAKAISAHTGVPVSAKFYANVATELPAIFEAEFPGYMRSGLAPLVAKRLAMAQAEA